MNFRDLFTTRRRRAIKRIDAATKNRETSTRALEAFAVYLEHDGSLYDLYERTGKAMSTWLAK